MHTSFETLAGVTEPQATISLNLAGTDPNAVPDIIGQQPIVAAMAERRKPPKATGNYTPAFPIPAQDGTQVIRSHWLSDVPEDPDEKNAHPAMTEVPSLEELQKRNPEDNSSALTLLAGSATLAAMTTDDGRGFYDFPEEPEADKNAQPATTDLPPLSELLDRQRRTEGKSVQRGAAGDTKEGGSHAKRGEFSLSGYAQRTWHRLTTAIGSIGVGPIGFAC